MQVDIVIRNLDRSIDVLLASNHSIVLISLCSVRLIRWLRVLAPGAVDVGENDAGMVQLPAGDVDGRGVLGGSGPEFEGPAAAEAPASRKPSCRYV